VVEKAVAVYARFAEIVVRDEEHHRVVSVTAKSPARERTIALELANYALGLTQQEGG
jgi:hypothetical protein